MKLSKLICLLCSVLAFGSSALAQTRPKAAPYSFVGPDALAASLPPPGMLNCTPLSPAQLAANEQSEQCSDAANANLKMGNYKVAEYLSRQSIKLSSGTGYAQQLLASALNAQGKEEEAMQVYEAKNIQSCSDGLPYALLLLKHNQFAKAVTVYNQVLPQIGGSLFMSNELFVEDNDFSVDSPDPAKLESDIHAALGLLTLDDYGIGDTQSSSEYQKALSLEPASPIANIATAAELKRQGDSKGFRAAMTFAATNYTGVARIAAQMELGIYVNPLSGAAQSATSK